MDAVDQDQWRINSGFLHSPQTNQPGVYYSERKTLHIMFDQLFAKCINAPPVSTHDAHTMLLYATKNSSGLSLSLGG